MFEQHSELLEFLYLQYIYLYHTCVLKSEFGHVWLLTTLIYLLKSIHPDNFTPFLTPEPSTYLSQKQKPLDNKLFLSQAQHSETRYRMIFVTQH